MAYATKFNPDALPAHAEPDEAAQILARRSDTSGTTSPQPTQQSVATPPPANVIRTDYNNKPPPPLPTATPGHHHLQQQPQQQQQPHRNTLSGAARPAQPLYSPTYSPVSATTFSTPPPAALQAGGLWQGGGSHGQQLLNAPSQQSRRPSTPSRGGDAALFPLFKAVDRTGTGQLSELELRQALLNGDYTNFDPETVRMMIRMHDHDGSGTIGFEEFCALWSFLASWRVLFDKFDEDHSGYISLNEYTNALVQFGYNLTHPFVNMLYRLYDRGNPQGLSFDLFVQSCLTLKRLTDVFKKYDTDRDGYITLSFEDFLTEILQSR